MRSARWVGWRLRGLIAAALVGCVLLFVLLRALVAQPVLDADLVAGPNRTVLLALPDETVAVTALHDVTGVAVPIDGALLERSVRWGIADVQRQRTIAQHEALSRALASGQVAFVRTDGLTFVVVTRPRGTEGLGWTFWFFAAGALFVYLIGMVVLFAKPDRRHVIYALMALTQVGALALMAVTAARSPGWAAGFMSWEGTLRAVLDLAGAAALLHLVSFTPRRRRWGTVQALSAWFTAGAIGWALAEHAVDHAWWWTQAALALAFGLATVQLRQAQRVRAHPVTGQLLRSCAAALATLLLLSLLVWLAGESSAAAPAARTAAATIWTLFVATLLLLSPLMARAQYLLREFALVAGVSTVATALDLLFAAIFSMGSFASLTLALFVSLGAYAGARQWLVTRLVARERMTTERMFEHLYRVAREIQRQPNQAVAQLGRLLRELFDPLHVQASRQRGSRARVTDDGARLVVPIPAAPDAPYGALVLGLAGRGRRLFTFEDARLADRIVELVGRAVEYDRAVEHGRNEERVRIAQDLHDDIGARLLTLMYQAPNREMEDYVRHTLKDLKTLTRGLAASSHRLSHAAAEWKADLGQRLGAADCELGWSFTFDHDFELSVVQWSALTRILRELVSNAIAHAQATRVDIDAAVQGGRLTLSVIDNGRGGDPATWAHGLGLGGVRKRVKQLGGEVRWEPHLPKGTACRVFVPEFGPMPPSDPS
ncbi:MAG TPA: ATP-binding protein [Burkholderiaceae bacterium]|nr:ATP-binding protein [Burkholderiaceae bacterium]